MTPSLPQHDTPAQQATRAQQLAAVQASLTYTHSTTVAPLGVAASLPKDQGFSPILLGGAATVVLSLVDDVLTLAAPLLTPRGDRVQLVGASEDEQKAAATALGELRALRDRLQGHQEAATHGRAVPVVTEVEDGQRAIGRAVGGVVGRVGGLVGKVDALERGVDALQRGADAVKETVNAALTDHPPHGPLSFLEDLVRILASLALQGLLRQIDLYGRARDLYAFVRQFSILLPPDVVSVWDEDRWFAQLRLAGPNPMVIRGITALPANFPVTDAQYQRVMGAQDSLAQAGADGRLYLCDYAALAGMPASSFPDGPKYLAAPLALFATPASGRGALRPVAIQLQQTPGRDNPIVQPGDDEAWRVAKLYVNSADGNHHELASHLGLTHLLIEAFAMATPRQLAPEHPLYVLLTPHFEGTLAINNAAVHGLIAPGGIVDRLLAGTIQGSTAVSVQSVLQTDVSTLPVPVALARRGVLDLQGLPDFPYRDDALLVWEAQERWVTDYLSLYYVTDADIAGDTELVAWLAELSAPQGGGLVGVPQSPSFDQLVALVTSVIFTASAQHAAVNFPQRTIMAFTPAMPLATYQPPPSSLEVSADALLDALPPLQDAFVQVSVGTLLGGVYFTRLGDYSRYLRTSYFQDARVAGPLGAFQRRLIQVENEIGRRNLSRVPYTQILPSAVPQSINI